MAPDHGLVPPGVRARRHGVDVAAQQQAVAAARARHPRDEVVAAAVVAVAADEGVARSREEADVVELDVDPVASQGARRAASGPRSRGRPVGSRRCPTRTRACARASVSARSGRSSLVASRAASRRRSSGGMAVLLVVGQSAPERSPKTMPCSRAKATTASRERSGGMVCGDVTLKAATSAPSSRALASGREASVARWAAAANGRPAASPVRTPPRSASPAPARAHDGTGRAGTCVQLPLEGEGAVRAGGDDERASRAARPERLGEPPQERARAPRPGGARRRGPRLRPRSGTGDRRRTGSPSRAPPRSRPW